MHILKRTVKSEVVDLSDHDIQFSVNSHGHFAIRAFKRDQPPAKMGDTLIVFTAQDSSKLVKFAKKCDHIVDN